MTKNTKKPKKAKKISKPKIRGKLTPKFVELKGFLSFFVLHELSFGAMSGDDLAKSIGERRGSVLTPGTIYPALKRLRRQKLIKYTREGRKKKYFLTSDGRKELKLLYNVFKGLFYGLKSKMYK
jgi:DNA-binding PadR family transcriptional regulator